MRGGVPSPGPSAPRGETPHPSGGGRREDWVYNLFLCLYGMFYCPGVWVFVAAGDGGPGRLLKVEVATA